MVSRHPFRLSGILTLVLDRVRMAREDYPTFADEVAEKDGGAMKLRQTIFTLVPALAALSFLWVCWDTFETFVIYGPRWLIVPAILVLMPLGVQFGLWCASEGRHIPRPFGIVLPLGLLLVLPLWPVGESLASRCPALCEVAFSVEVEPKRPGKFGPDASFSVGATGRGNPSSYEFSLVTLVYTLYPNERREDLYIRLPQWDGFYINSYTTFFPVTKEKVFEHVQGTDDFPEGEAAAITDELWTVLRDLVDQRHMPPVVFREQDPAGPRVEYWVPRRNAYLVTACLCVPILLGVSWLLARRYGHFIQDQ